MTLPALDPRSISVGRDRGAHLLAIASARCGAQETVWQLRWRSPLVSFSQVSVPLAPIRSNTRERKAFSPQGTTRPSRPKEPSKHALAWAIAQLRKEIGTSCRMSDQQQRNLCTGIGASVWRAMNRGELRAGPSLAVFLQELICRLREVQSSQRAWCSLGGCALRGVINDQCIKR